MFGNYMTDYRERLNVIFTKYNIDMIVYDEMDSFKDSKDPLYDYPFEDRKNKISYYSFNIYFTVENLGSYTYNSDEIAYSIS